MCWFSLAHRKSCDRSSRSSSTFSLASSEEGVATKLGGEREDLRYLGVDTARPEGRTWAPKRARWVGVVQYAAAASPGPWQLGQHGGGETRAERGVAVALQPLELAVDIAPSNHRCRHPVELVASSRSHRRCRASLPRAPPAFCSRGVPAGACIWRRKPRASRGTS